MFALKYPDNDSRHHFYEQLQQPTILPSWNWVISLVALFDSERSGLCHTESTSH